MCAHQPKIGSQFWNYYIILSAYRNSEIHINEMVSHVTMLQGL